MNQLKAKKPTVFVSSTCFDLSQVRNDIRLFIEDNLGFNALLSEFDSFPVSPDLDTVENCVKTVDNDADIFVLIIGGRYGYETNSGKSITNIEYLYAVKKGIPIYVFVLENVLNSLSIWSDNPDGNFSSVVATNKVFEFIDQIRNKSKSWIYPFKYAQDITKVLANQLAYLIYDSLSLRLKVSNRQLSKKLLSLDGDSLRLILEEEDSWPYKLIGTLLTEGIESTKELKDNYTYQISHGKSIEFEDFVSLNEWIIEKNNDLQVCSNNLTKLFNSALTDALAPDGVSSDPEKIIYSVQNIINVYQSILEWSLEYDRVVLEDDEDEDLQEFIRAARLFSKSIIEDIENYAIDFNKKVSEALNTVAQRDTDEPQIFLDLTFHLRSPETKAYMAILEKLRKRYVG